MIAVAGEVADGLILHAFNSPRSLRETALVALEAALSSRNRARADIEVSLPMLIVTGADDDAMRAAHVAVRRQIAFYASTPTYRWILDLHGWSATGEQLTELSRSGGPDRWTAMADLIDEEMLDAFAVVGPPSSLPASIASRYGGLVDRVSLYLPYAVDAELVAAVAHGVRRIPSSATERQPA